MRYIEAPENYRLTMGCKSIFLAGGITGCPDWQKDVVAQLHDVERLDVLNPRRANFPIHDPSAAEKQIEWEFNHLRKATAILFWFPCETLCPIVLYELGAHSMTSKQLFVGTHPDYPRRQDVEIQTRLMRSDLQIHHSLEDLTKEVRDWALHDPW